MTERKPSYPKQPFELSDQWAQITGLELTEEQLMGDPVDIVEHYKKKVKAPADLAGSDPLVGKWPTKRIEE